jgi:DNA-binding transcriptional regulator YiaG
MDTNPTPTATELARVRRLCATGAARAIRETAGLSLAEVGAAAHVERTTIWKWEKARRRPHGDAAIRYLRVLEEMAR